MTVETNTQKPSETDRSKTIEELIKLKPKTILCDVLFYDYDDVHQDKKFAEIIDIYLSSSR